MNLPTTRINPGGRLEVYQEDLNAWIEAVVPLLIESGYPVALEPQQAALLQSLQSSTVTLLNTLPGINGIKADTSNLKRLLIEMREAELNNIGMSLAGVTTVNAKLIEVLTALQDIRNAIANQTRIGNRIPVITNLTLTNANTAYSHTFPTGTTRYSFKCRGDVGDTIADIRYAWSGAIVAPIEGLAGAPQPGYEILPLTSEESETVAFDVPTTVYFASAKGSITLTIRYWKNS